MTDRHQASNEDEGEASDEGESEREAAGDDGALEAGASAPKRSDERARRKDDGAAVVVPTGRSLRWADRLAILALSVTLLAAFGGMIFEIVLSATE